MCNKKAGIFALVEKGEKVYTLAYEDKHYVRSGIKNAEDSPSTYTIGDEPGNIEPDVDNFVSAFGQSYFLDVTLPSIKDNLGNEYFVASDEEFEVNNGYVEVTRQSDLIGARIRRIFKTT